MIWDYVSAISGFVGTVLSFLVAVYSFVVFRNAAIRYRIREERLPVATLFEDLQLQVVNQKESLTNLRNELQEAQTMIGQAHVMRAEYSQLQEKCDRVRNELDGLSSTYAERKRDAEKVFHEETTRLQGDFKKLEDQMRQEQRTLELSLADARQSLSHDLEQTRKEWESRKKTVEIASRAELLELEQSLASQKSSLTSAIEQLEREQKTETETLEAEHDSVISEMQRELDRKKTRMTVAFEQQKADFISQLELLKEQTTKAEKDREKLIKALESDNQKTVSDMQSDFERRKARITSAFEQQKEDFDLQIELLKEQAVQAEREADRLSNLNVKLSVDIEKLSQSRSELSIAVDALRSEKESIEKALPQLQDLWKRLLEQTGGGTDSDRTAELWQPVFTYAELENNFSEEEGLLDVQKYLQSCGLQYSRRTLLAFHTSLKVSDSSPLVVLAGISGTGKSELPRRYAEALGINFLPMAVQPRWDSPQDMFGFFNYLENRFRATELGRSLVQMDPYYNESGRGWPAELPNSYENLSNQMLMVLLDEMNLARVEYYFSEFLSRLEIRRGVREHDAADRRKAELAFEIGRSAFGSPTMNIFVANNVLFVGTMNEDETTQTLSDKVVDRANVIRFGRPRSLELTRRPEPLVPTTYRLDVNTWDEWRSPQEMPQENYAQLEEWIEKLNQAMSQVKRPFAHRTSQSIRSYVANYPRIDAQWYQHAMADQIEQKLLPKFRGLDPSEAEVKHSLDKIRDIADALEDKELVEAIKISRDGHQFSWSGIDRATSPEAET
jgi:hypothetical protein